jgi:putative ABC transport system permease protein
VSDADTRDRPFVAVVSESFVRRHWPGLDPIGRRFNFALSDREVVGVVRDIRVRGLERSSEPQVYVPSRQVDDGSLIGYTPGDLVVRASVSPATLLPAIRRIVREADPEQPISNVRTLDDIVAEQTGSRSVQLRVIAGFAALAFLLAAVGIHALLSFAVSQRSQEIGVRMVLGATPRDILSIVLGRAAVLAAVGIVPGVGLAYAAGRAMSALLAGVTPGDPPAFLVAVALAVVMTLAGCLAPTLRAVRVDPIRSIRAE